MATPKGTRPWNAGTSKGWLDDKGYRWIYVEENGIRRARREHRVVMEKVLGRRLEPSEEVHHINHDKQDNRPTNLFVIGHSEHTQHHHEGSERSDLAKARMANAARHREEIKHLRRVIAELLEALENVAGIAGQFGSDAEFRSIEDLARAAIDKARGKQEAAQANPGRSSEEG